MAKCEDCGSQYSGFWSVFSSARSSEERYISGIEASFKTLTKMGILERPFSVYPNAICTDCLRKRNDITRDLYKAIDKEFAGIQRGDFVRGVKTQEVGWIKFSRLDSPSEFETKARELALACGAVALIKSSWVKESETYVKGHGKKGNPYYGTRHYFRGEALAVKSVMEKSNKIRSSDAVTGRIETSAQTANLSFNKPKLVVLDASNIARAATPDVRRIGCIARALRSLDLKFIFLFDANFSHIFNLDHQPERLINSVGLEVGEGGVVPSGSRADDFIIQFGERDGSIIVTNDLFRDQPERVKKLNLDRKMSKFLVFGDNILIPDLNLDVSVL